MNEEQPKPRTIKLYDRQHLPVGSTFRTSDQSRYGVSPNGAFVRLDKDRRSVKERKRARRQSRRA